MGVLYVSEILSVPTINRVLWKGNWLLDMAFAFAVHVGKSYLHGSLFCVTKKDKLMLSSYPCVSPDNFWKSGAYFPENWFGSDTVKIHLNFGAF